MFVLCPHCQFLVGIEPRTGKPPTHCPKCNGVVIEALPEPAAVETPPTAAALDPFAPVELPSVAPTLPEPDAEVEAAASEKVEVEPARVEPKAAVPASTKAAAEPASPATPAATDATPTKPVATRRRNGPPAAVPPQPQATADERAKDSAPTAESGRAEAMIEALLGRRRVAKKAEDPAPPPAAAATPAPTAPAAPAAPAAPTAPTAPVAPIAPASAVEAVEVEVDALPPAVQVEDVVAAPDDSTLDATADTMLDGDRAAPIAEDHVDAPAPADAADVAVAAESAATGDLFDAPPAEHPLRRRTDPGVTSDSPEPAQHPMRRRTDTAPSFTRPRTRAALRVGWHGFAACAALALLLALQLLLAQRDTLAANARWRPVVSGLCAALRCSVPPWREPAAFTMLSRDVRPNPAAPGTLLINASFRNDARWPQPWPQLLLTLSDLDGRMVGARSFAAAEYLDGERAGNAATPSELAPGQTAALTLVVVEPAPDIVAFTFDFR